MTSRRVRLVKQGMPGTGPVVYWMRREHRARDNWGLLHAQSLALAAGRPLVVAYALARGYLGAGLRQFRNNFV